MPPMRLGGGAYWRAENWFVRMGLLHAFGQRDLGVNDTPTAGYNLLKMEITNKRYWRDSPWGPTEITTGLTGDNLLDVDVRNSVQFHKDEILLPGRSIKFFMNAKFGAEPSAGKASAGYYKGPTALGPPLLYKAPIVTAWSWTGPYLGINVGYSAGKSKTDAMFSDPTGAPLFATGSSDNLNGVIAGFQGGHNWMASSWLMAGIEADIQLSTQNTTPTFICPGALCNPAIGDVAPAAAALDRAQKLDWFATVRGRLGAIVTPDIIMYLTCGLAVAEIKTAGTVAGFSSGCDDHGNPIATAVGLGFYDHRTKAGWTAGAGFETHLSGNLTGKV